MEIWIQHIFGGLYLPVKVQFQLESNTATPNTCMNARFLSGLRSEITVGQQIACKKEASHILLIAPSATKKMKTFNIFSLLVSSPGNSGSTSSSLWTSLVNQPGKRSPLQLGGGSSGRKYRNMLRKVSTRWSYLGHGSSGNTVTLACLMDLLLAFRPRCKPSRMKLTCG